MWKRFVLLVGAVLVILAVIAGLSFFTLMSSFGWTPETAFDMQAANLVATQVANGTFKPDANGRVTLTGALAHLSSYGQIYVTRNSSGTVWILFQTAEGKGTNLRGYLYCSAPAVGAVPTTINVLGPQIGSPPTALIDYSVDHQIDPNWYQVHFDLN